MSTFLPTKCTLQLCLRTRVVQKLPQGNLVTSRPTCGLICSEGVKSVMSPYTQQLIKTTTPCVVLSNTFVAHLVGETPVAR